MIMAQDIDYKALQTELDGILDKLQNAEFDIDEAIKSYERGMEIITQLEAYLKQAENKVTKLQTKFDT